MSEKIIVSSRRVRIARMRSSESGSPPRIKFCSGSGTLAIALGSESEVSGFLALAV